MKCANTHSTLCERNFEQSDRCLVSSQYVLHIAYIVYCTRTYTTIHFDISAGCCDSFKLYRIKNCVLLMLLLLGNKQKHCQTRIETISVAYGVYFILCIASSVLCGVNCVHVCMLVCLWISTLWVHCIYHRNQYRLRMTGSTYKP